MNGKTKRKFVELSNELLNDKSDQILELEDCVNRLSEDIKYKKRYSEKLVTDSLKKFCEDNEEIFTMIEELGLQIHKNNYKIDFVYSTSEDRKYFVTLEFKHSNRIIAYLVGHENCLEFDTTEGLAPILDKIIKGYKNEEEVFLEEARIYKTIYTTLEDAKDIFSKNKEVESFLKTKEGTKWMKKNSENMNG